MWDRYTRWSFCPRSVTAGSREACRAPARARWVTAPWLEQSRPRAFGGWAVAADHGQSKICLLSFPPQPPSYPTRRPGRPTGLTQTPPWGGRTIETLDGLILWLDTSPQHGWPVLHCGIDGVAHASSVGSQQSDPEADRFRLSAKVSTRSLTAISSRSATPKPRGTTGGLNSRPKCGIRT
jgi:hypothetical protein